MPNLFPWRRKSRFPKPTTIRRLTRWLLFCVPILLPHFCHADFALYTLPGSTLTLQLEGKVTHNPGGTSTLRHPRGTLYFSSTDLRIIKSPSVASVYGRKLRKVNLSPDVDEMLGLAKWALHNGMLDKCKTLLGAAWKVDSKHPRLQKLAGFMQYLNRDVESSSEIEQKARDLVGGKSMEFSRSKHFLLLHDRNQTKDPVTRKTRAEMRLALLETVYESYFLTFALEGHFMRPPTEMMPVVLFSDHADFMQLERRLEMGLRQVAGFYLPKHNISIFYDSGTTPMFQSLKKFSAELEGVKAQMKRARSAAAGEVIRLANSLQLLIDIQRESEDISVVSHEAVHQLAANSGLFPHDGVFVRWVHEGLASFFESAKLSRWSGVGVVDLDRIGYYRVLEGDPVRGSLEFIVSDLGFLFEGSLGNQLPAYGQAWALTHFLFHRRFDQLMTFYKEIQELEIELTAETVKQRGDEMLAIFDECFGDRAALELEWRRYMRTLKTDMERLNLE